MTDRPRQQILALIAKYGPDVLDMSRTVESKLHLTCPDQPDEVNALVAALRHGVVHYLLVLAENGNLPTADLPAQIQRLHAESGLSQSRAERAVGLWANVLRDVKGSDATGVSKQREPRGLHPTAILALGPVVVVGAVGALASMLPWVVVLAERPGEHFLIPRTIDALGTHTLLNLMGAAGGFLGGGLGWMLGTPLSLEFVVAADTTSTHRVVVAALAAAVGSFLGLWLGYHHVADVGAFLGAFLGAGAGAFLTSVFTWDR